MTTTLEARKRTNTNIELDISLPHGTNHDRGRLLASSECQVVKHMHKELTIYVEEDG